MNNPKGVARCVKYHPCAVQLLPQKRNGQIQHWLHELPAACCFMIEWQPPCTHPGAQASLPPDRLCCSSHHPYTASTWSTRVHTHTQYTNQAQLLHPSIEQQPHVASTMDAPRVHHASQPSMLELQHVETEHQRALQPGTWAAGSPGPVSASVPVGRLQFKRRRQCRQE